MSTTQTTEVITADGQRINLEGRSIADALKAEFGSADRTMYYQTAQGTAFWTGGSGGAEGLVDLANVPAAVQSMIAGRPE